MSDRKEFEGRLRAELTNKLRGVVYSKAVPIHGLTPDVVHRAFTPGEVEDMKELGLLHYAGFAYVVLGSFFDSEESSKKDG